MISVKLELFIHQHPSEIVPYLKMKLLIVIPALVAAACAAPAGPPVYHAPQPSYHPAPKPSYHPAPKYHEPVYEPRPYEYAYGVKDEYTGTNFEAAESSDGNAVYGHYSVLLPDGRLQNVKYTADHYTGYVADVSYEGHAVPYHPAPVKGGYHAAPVHKPAPVYHPAPIHKPIYKSAPIHKPAPIYHG